MRFDLPVVLSEAETIGVNIESDLDLRDTMRGG
jgi:hypothetical protein